MDYHTRTNMANDMNWMSTKRSVRKICVFTFVIIGLNKDGSTKTLSHRREKH